MAAVAKLSTTMHLLLCRQQQPSSAAAVVTPNCSASNLAMLSFLPFGDVTVKRIGTLRRRNSRSLSASRRRFSFRAPVLASQEASTSTLLVQEVEFTWKGQGSEVLLTGDFLNWEAKIALEKRSNGVFSIKQKLASGKYSYKFIVDGEWKHSPDSPTVPDGTGGFNNEVILEDQITAKASEDLGNGTQADSPAPTKTVKAAEESGSGVAVKNVAAPAEPSPKTIPKKAQPESLEKIMSDKVIPQLRSALQKEEGLTDLDVTFEDNQLKTSFSKGNIPYCFWAFFPDGILEGSRGSSFTSHGSPPSTIEPFLVDEKKITPELLVFWVKKRLFAQKILAAN